MKKITWKLLFFVVDQSKRNQEDSKQDKGKEKSIYNMYKILRMSTVRVAKQVVILCQTIFIF